MGLAASDPDGPDRTEDGVDADGSDDAADTDRADRAEDGVDADGSDDATDTDRADGSQDRIYQQWINVGNTIECDRVPDPADGAVREIHRALGWRREYRQGKCR